LSTAGRAPLRAFAHRRAPRCPLAVPVRVTMLRGGAPHSISGRALNLGEGGIAISLADEVRISDSVAVEFLLPDLGLGLQARAVVRYRVDSHSGLEFRGLTRHQQAVIREWTRQRQSPPERNPTQPEEKEKKEKPTPRFLRYYSKVPLAKLQRVILPILAALVLIALFAFWQWERAWKDLEDQTHPAASQLLRQPRVNRSEPAQHGSGAQADDALFS
jgi:hypothetical protein